MGRYRPPQPKASPYITREGYDRLQQEMRRLWDRRAEVTQALAAAAAEGDRSENAEYIYRKKELGGIDRRIRYLQKRLPELTIAPDAPSNPQQIFFGARVTLESDNGETVEYRIVGPDELAPDQGDISIDSPLARALLKKAVDDEVRVETPGGSVTYYINAIDYNPQRN
ncbi:transcription elongation factor GreB [Thiohalophilus thiocyanatoxydans]|uniref:Transcription elongation factor GreB n=1 Tax=Thiohalophilus thiocyanatoxydans TaxID=381308 RepID=A0A4R8IRG8_9GAMM|nr:transcription elongation factor GreB [Thiohalophilus thiocyanatoxydans]TDY02934.1 transcription elongation factor GreB [Thiohalophilus thiocyanatoxydans]